MPGAKKEIIPYLVPVPVPDPCLYLASCSRCQYVSTASVVVSSMCYYQLPISHTSAASYYQQQGLPVRHDGYPMEIPTVARPRRPWLAASCVIQSFQFLLHPRPPPALLPASQVGWSAVFQFYLSSIHYQGTAPTPINAVLVPCPTLPGMFPVPVDCNKPHRRIACRRPWGRYYSPTLSGPPREGTHHNTLCCFPGYKNELRGTS